MSIRNKVQLVGHLGQDPEMKTFGENGKLARIRIATNEGYYNQQKEWVEKTEWHSVIAWRNVAERIEKQLKKGSFVLIEGKLINRDYTDSNNEKRFITEVEALTFMVLDKKPSQEKQTVTINKVKEVDTVDFYTVSKEDDDLPF